MNDSAVIERLLTPGQVAQLLHVSVASVRGYERAGKLPAVRTPGNHRRFREQDVRAFIEERRTA